MRVMLATRRVTSTFLLATLVIAACAPAAVPAPATVQTPAAAPASPRATSVAATASPAPKPVAIKVGASTPPGDPVIVALESVGKDLSSKTNGRITIQIFPGGQLGGSLEIIDQVSKGTIQMAIFNPLITASVEPRMGVFAAPFLFPDADSLYRAADSPTGQEVFEPLRAKKGIRVLDSWFLGSWVFAMKSKTVNQCADLKGVKVRTPPGPVLSRYMEICGAAALQMSFGDVYLALQTGTIDGIPIPLSIIESGKLYEVTKFLTSKPILFDIFQPLVNEQFWQSLSPADQKLVKDAFRAGRATNDKIVKEAETKVVEKLRGLKFTISDNPDVASFRTAADQLVRELSKDWGGSDFVQRLQKAGSP